MPAYNVIPVNTDQFAAEDDPDYEAILENDGTEWVDVDVLSPSRERSVLDRDHLSQSQAQTLFKSWAQVAAVSTERTHSDERGDLASFSGFTVKHKAEVPLVFLAFHHVRAPEAAPQTLLFHVAAVVANAVSGAALDAVQPMHSGWYIYMRTMADRECLVQGGITIAGRHVTLHSEVSFKQ